MRQVRVFPQRRTAPTAAADTQMTAVPSRPAVCISQRNSRVSVVELRGELDIDGGQLVRGALEDVLTGCTDRVELDLSRVTFCDCSGLHVLLAAHEQALAQGTTLTVRAAGPAVQRIMDMTGTSELLTGSRPEEDTLSGEEDLQTEVTQLRRAMRTRPPIDQAIGVLMATFSLSPEDAWNVLVAVSQNTNTKLHRIAEQLLATVQGEALPGELRPHIAAAVDALRSTDGGPPE
ncbi:hypothetical protein JCM4814A_09720 [Streptomyces phaeofaciens JCM 4814]|uniref:Anti-sigma factor antagonist n=2 Tax=Streptomyces phaeofaciens TaxID=68254 RepID=A0A918HIL8_9ACTN|nr:hypothetical protein GCM10010226_52660 [Streptomyces phaeofaciens]